MARHKVYGSMTPWFRSTTGEVANQGRTVGVGSRIKITEFDIDLNADCNGQQNLEGVITVKYDEEKDRCIIVIDCPEYDVVVQSAKHRYKYNKNKHN